MGKRRRYFSTIAISAAALVCYFPAAFYLKTSYSNDQPAGLRPLAICRTGVPHIYAASLWLPDTVDSVNIYENGTMIGKSDTVYLHPERTYAFNGKHWKIISSSSTTIRSAIARPIPACRFNEHDRQGQR